MKTVRVDDGGAWSPWTWAEAVPGWVQLLALALVAGLLLWQLARVLGRTGGGTACRWKRDPVSRGKSLTRWQCMGCGVDAYSSDGKRPKECKRGLREVGL